MKASMLRKYQLLNDLGFIKAGAIYKFNGWDHYQIVKHKENYLDKKFKGDSDFTFLERKTVENMPKLFKLISNWEVEKWICTNQEISNSVFFNMYNEKSDFDKLQHLMDDNPGSFKMGIVLRLHDGVEFIANKTIVKSKTNKAPWLVTELTVSKDKFTCYANGVDIMDLKIIPE